eukprot:scaffold1411_cov252-Pinguiococcus_pyrenoidosus.AAC.19
MSSRPTRRSAKPFNFSGVHDFTSASKQTVKNSFWISELVALRLSTPFRKPSREIFPMESKYARSLPTLLARLCRRDGRRS